MGRLLTPAKRRTKKKDPEKVAQSKLVWEQKEQRKNARGRYEGALQLARMMIEAGHHEAAEMCGEYAALIAMVNRLHG